MPPDRQLERKRLLVRTCRSRAAASICRSANRHRPCASTSANSAFETALISHQERLTTNLLRLEAGHRAARNIPETPARARDVAAAARHSPASSAPVAPRRQSADSRHQPQQTCRTALPISPLHRHATGRPRPGPVADQRADVVRVKTSSHFMPLSARRAKRRCNSAESAIVGHILGRSR